MEEESENLEDLEKKLIEADAVAVRATREGRALDAATARKLANEIIMKIRQIQITKEKNQINIEIMKKEEFAKPRDLHKRKIH